MSIAKPGIALRALRKKNHWTIADVSKRTGVPSSTISRIENDLISPTYDLLGRLSVGLVIDLAQLLSASADSKRPESEQPGRRSVNRGNEGELVEASTYSIRYLSADLRDKRIDPAICEYRARTLAEFGEMLHHQGEEFVYVVKGELALYTECYAPLHLKVGESTYFDSRMGHAYISRGKGPCWVLSVCTFPRTSESATTI